MIMIIAVSACVTPSDAHGSFSLVLAEGGSQVFDHMEKLERRKKIDEAVVFAFLLRHHKLLSFIRYFLRILFI